MLVRPDGDSVLCIGQASHAWISGQMARAWAEPFERHDEVCLAAEQHDVGMAEWDLALRNVHYVLNAAGNLAEDFAPPKGGFIDRRADTVLRESVELLERIADHPRGLMDAIADGTFGITKRPIDGGKGMDGVVELSADAYNPALELLEEKEVARA